MFSTPDLSTLKHTAASLVELAFYVLGGVALLRYLAQ